MASIKAVSADAWCPSRPRVGTRPANNGNHQKLMEPQKPKDPYLEMLVPSCSFCGFSSAANILLYKNIGSILSSQLLKTTLSDVLNYVWLRIKHKAADLLTSNQSCSLHSPTFPRWFLLSFIGPWLPLNQVFFLSPSVKSSKLPSRFGPDHSRCFQLFPAMSLALNSPE